MPKKGDKYKGVYEHPPGSGRYMIDYKDARGKRVREIIGPNIDEARAVLEKRRTQVRDQTYFPKRKKVVLADAIRSFLQGDGAGKRSWKDDRNFAAIWVREMGDAFLDSITTSQLERLRNKWARDLSHSSVNHRLSFLRRIFNIAIRDGHIDKNPVSQVRFYRDTCGVVRYLSDEDQATLQQHFPKRWWYLVIFAIKTGLRQAEQFMLRWEHVDFQAGVLTIPRSKHGEQRHVPMHPEVLKILSELPNRATTGWVFLGPRGRRLNGKNFYRRVYQPALEAAGLIPPLPKPAKADKRKGPGRRRERLPVNWHTLRHTTASRLVMAGVDLPTVKEIMGHKTLSITMRYAHLAPKHVRDAIARI